MLDREVVYVVEKWIPTTTGAHIIDGVTYRWYWMARLAKWCAELCPDLRPYKRVTIERLVRDGDSGEGES